ncbi:MAG: PAS domain S-box protein, partial [Ardenticatenaceae bacterium]|nr:PAS domain S-box protein [Ardenticatenaceae bacterium]
MTGSQNNHNSQNNSILNIFANTQDGAYAVDGEQTIVFWNEAAEQMLGYSKQDALGMKCWQLMKGHSTEGSSFCRLNCQVMNNISQGKAGENFDLLVKHRDGHNLLVNVSTLPLPHHPGHLEHPRLMHLARFLADEPMQPGRLRIHLLGPTIVWRPDGTLVEGPLWRRIKVRALLVYLALQRGPVPRETLIEVLWPDLDYEAGLRNLNTTVYNLRRSLEPNLGRGSDSIYVIYEGGNYRLDNSQSHWLDVQAFEQGIRRARVEREQEKAIAIYKETLALYRGEYLTDLGNTEVVCSGEQHRLSERYLA